jgi:hypothetical protein
LLQVGLDVETSAMCKQQQQFGLDVNNLALVLIFNFGFSIKLQFRAGRYKISHLQQYLIVRL